MHLCSASAPQNLENFLLHGPLFLMLPPCLALLRQFYCRLCGTSQH